MRYIRFIQLLIIILGIVILSNNVSYSLDAGSTEIQGTIKGALRSTFTNYVTALDVDAFDKLNAAFEAETGIVLWQITPIFHVLKSNEKEISPYLDAWATFYGMNAKTYDAGIYNYRNTSNFGGISSGPESLYELNIGLWSLGMFAGDLFTKDFFVAFDVFLMERWISQGAGFMVGYKKSLADETQVRIRAAYNKSDETQDSRPIYRVYDFDDPYYSGMFQSNVIRYVTMEYQRPIQRFGLYGELIYRDLTVKLGSSIVWVDKKSYSGETILGTKFAGRELPSDVGYRAYGSFGIYNIFADMGDNTFSVNLANGLESPAGGYDLDNKQTKAVYTKVNNTFKIDNYMNQIGFIWNTYVTYTKDGNPDDNYTLKNKEYTAFFTGIRPVFFLSKRFHYYGEANIFGKQYRNTIRTHIYDQTISFKQGFQISLDDDPIKAMPTSLFSAYVAMGIYNYPVTETEASPSKYQYRAEMMMSTTF